MQKQVLSVLFFICGVAEHEKIYKINLKNTETGFAEDTTTQRSHAARVVAIHSQLSCSPRTHSFRLQAHCPWKLRNPVLRSRSRSERAQRVGQPAEVPDRGARTLLRRRRAGFDSTSAPWGTRTDTSSQNLRSNQTPVRYQLQTAKGWLCITLQSWPARLEIVLLSEQCSLYKFTSCLA